MSTPFSKAPHIEGLHGSTHPSQAPNAALLVDFDNVTMGMRSDLSKELKTLLNSDIIKGKVTVQRAYADWRRYPQYIVPLSEASIDLIFAPAYGSSKKNATDIRMAIDGMELVFTRPEIGTYILLTGDSDFSSLVLKLKEYGKYVIGVGIQESSSDILVQNCDEYYSYTSLSGLRKTSDGTGPSAQDPWVLVEKSVEQMKKRNDVMRSDRLKQVMLELDPGFDEKSFGFSKFSRFLTEAAQKGLIQLRKMENGQYEVIPSGGGQRSQPSTPDRSRERDSRRGSSRRDESRKSEPAREKSAPAASSSRGSEAPARGAAALKPAYDLMTRAIEDLLEDQEGDAVRDSDVKRRMLAIQSNFDEAELGFSKFSLFLKQADDDAVVRLKKGDNGQFHVSLGGAAASDRAPDAASTRDAPRAGEGARTAAAPAASDGSRDARPADTKPEPSKPESDEKAAAGAPETSASRRLRPRLSSRRGRRGGDGPPPLMEGQVVGSTSSPRDDEASSPRSSTSTTHKPDSGSGRTAEPTRSDHAPAGENRAAGTSEVMDPHELRLPTGRDSVIKYLSNSYRGVGQKTAESLVDALGEDLFRVLQTNPSRVEDILPPARAERVLEGWEEDFARRRERVSGGSSGGGGGKKGGGGGSQSTGGGGRKEAASGASAGSDSGSSGSRRGRRTRGGGRTSR